MLSGKCESIEEWIKLLEDYMDIINDCIEKIKDIEKYNEKEIQAYIDKFKYNLIMYSYYLSEIEKNY